MQPCLPLSAKTGIASLISTLRNKKASYHWRLWALLDSTGGIVLGVQTQESHVKKELEGVTELKSIQEYHETIWHTVG